MISYFKNLKRSDYILFLVIFVISIIMIRSLDLLYIETQVYKSEIEKREIKSDIIQATRGTIVDRNGSILAESMLTDTLGVKSTKIFFEENTEESLKKLCIILNKKYSHFVRDLKNKEKKKFIYIGRHLLPSTVKKISELNLKGIGYEKEFLRFYPEGESTGNLIGNTNKEHIGKIGYEASFEKHLKEQNGEKIVRKDRNGKIVDHISLIIAPKDGDELKLTIDKRLQYVAYREIKKQAELVNAKSGSVVILDTTNGDILALASYPSFDPNDKNSYTTEKERNRAIMDSIEPASTIKPFLIAAALHSGKLDLKDMFDTNPGYKKFGRKKYKDTKNNGIVNYEDVLIKSSNIGSILISQEFDKEIYHDLLEYVGFGEKININFPSESGGKLDHHSYWHATDEISHSIGYALKVSPLQLAKAYSIIANEGIVINPRIIKKQSIRKDKKQKYEKSFSKVKYVLEKVVEEGSGKRASVKGYSVGGKTGTAEKYMGGKQKKYNKKEHTSLFAGIIPIIEPKLVIVVVIDEPKTKPNEFFGGHISAPVFRKVAADSLRILNISPDKKMDYQKQVSTMFENLDNYTLKTPEVPYVF
ncbi:MAG: penicillin-binding protein 2 [Gammaproteobacteria bacterium]|nr:penicillin-binding protein 2 [Gammaproteobacteria bacterium]MBT7814834.1 penicillin-binding protein 2 [Gammaproteobacteria bacterium]